MDNDTASEHDSLADSAYEIISATNTRSSDDEESTRDEEESLMSFGDPSPSEQDSTSHPEYVSPEASRVITPAPDISDDEDELPSLHFPTQPPPSVERSEFTDRTFVPTPKASTSLGSSTSQEANGLTEISHTVDSSRLRFFMDSRALGNTRVSIQQTVAPEKLDINQTFRILWHGSFKYQDEVIQKIGEALAVSNHSSMESSILKNSSSRFSIVPLSSFAGDESPEVTMIPAGKEIIVDKCEACQTNLRNLKSQSKTRHSRSRSPAPDLEVFYYSAKTGPFDEFDDIRPYTPYPCLDIRPTSGWLRTEPFSPSRGKAVHMRVEEVSADETESVKVLRVPIDLDHFQDLDPVLLNRNLRCLLDSKVQKSTSPGFFPLLQETYCTVVEEIENATGMSARRAALSVLLTNILLYFLIVNVISRGVSQPKPGFVVSPASTAYSTSTIGETITVTSTVQTTISASTSAPSLLNASAAKPSQIGTHALSAPVRDVNQQPLQFELIGVSEGKLYLKLPPELVKLRRQPSIKVSAHTENRPIDVTVTKWNASIYQVELNNLQRPQPVTVTVDAEKAGGARQVFHIDLRDPWNSLRAIESGLFACLATSRDVAQVARKELALFRDQANGLILSSSEWLREHMGQVRHGGGSAAGDLWQRLSTRRDLITTFSQRSPSLLLDNARERVETANKALTQRITALIETSKSLERSLTNQADVELERIWRRWKTLPGTPSLPRLDPTAQLKEASRRASILARKASDLIVFAGSKAQRESTGAVEGACEDYSQKVYVSKGKKKCGKRSERCRGKCRNSRRKS